MLLLIAAVVGSVVYVLLVNWAFDHFIPALASGDSAGAEVTTSSNSTIAVTIKIVGIILICAFMYRQSTKR